MKNRIHYNRCPICKGYLVQLGYLDGQGGWFPDPANIWCCLDTSHPTVREETYYTVRFQNKAGVFTPVKWVEQEGWKDDSTGVY